ncbi:hypothetical protein ACOMHN_026432 [Nucella lapillus]
MSAHTSDPSALTANGPSTEGPAALQTVSGEEIREKRDVADPKAQAQDSPLLAALPESILSALRDQRSCSDAYVHAVSRSRAAAVAALAKASSGELKQHGDCNECYQHHHHRHHQHQQQKQHNPLLLPLLHQHLDPLHWRCPLHHSQGSLPGARAGNGCSAAKPRPTRCHSQSSLARLKVKPPADHHTSSAGSLSRSRRALVPEEEVTYVWRDGRVQVQDRAHATRNGVGYSENRSSLGQHVEYLWQGGNVQKVIRGPNNETLAREVVPPRGQVKGMNYCIIYCLLFVFVITIIALIFVLKVLY